MVQTPQEYIRRLIKKGYKEQWIAKKVDVSQSTISRIKEGIVQHPRWETAMKIERIYLQFVR